MVLASGIVLDTGQPFVSTAEYPMDRSLLFGHYQEVGVKYEQPPHEWSGWSNFDGNSSMYVFGYGSLTRPESLSTELSRPVSRAQMTPAELKGDRKSTRLNSSHIPLSRMPSSA